MLSNGKTIKAFRNMYYKSFGESTFWVYIQILITCTCINFNSKLVEGINYLDEFI